MFDFESIRAHLAAKAAAGGPVPLDYVSLHDGARFNHELSRVMVGSRPQSEWIQEVVDNLQDAAEEAREAGETVVRVRAKFFRGKAPAGSRVYASEGASTEQATPAGFATREEAQLARDSELVATIRELRMLTTAMAADMSSQNMNGYRLAAEAAREARDARQAQMHLQLELVKLQLQMQFSDKPDELMSMAKDMLPQLAMAVLTRAPAPEPQRPPTLPPPIPAESPASGPSPDSASE